MQWAAWVITDSLFAGALTAALVFGMREVTQAEYRWIERNGGLRAAMPWWKGLDVRLWDTHSRMDVLLPVAATLAASVFSAIWRSV